MPSSPKPQGGGLPYAVGAYFLWGLLPLYFAQLRAVPAIEIVGFRILFTIPVCLVIVALRRQIWEVAAVFAQPRVLGALAASAVLICTNWLIYVYAVMNQHVFAASLGYYINPLVNIFAGTVFLRERLSRLQWAAVVIAGIGVALLAFGALEMLWISLTLAFSFAGYGLIRKLVPVGSLPGLTIETLLLALPALGVVTWIETSSAGWQPGDGWTDTLVVLSGAITAMPLLMFATAARRMSYSTLGFVQFLSPTIAFFVGLFYFEEPLRPVQLLCFLFIWAAIAVFIADLLLAHRRSNLTATRA